MQRILLITPDEVIIKKIEAVGDLNTIQQDITFSLEGIGFSLVNNISKQELLYLSISRLEIFHGIQFLFSLHGT